MCPLFLSSLNSIFDFTVAPTIEYTSVPLSTIFEVSSGTFIQIYFLPPSDISTVFLPYFSSLSLFVLLKLNSLTNDIELGDVTPVCLISILPVGILSSTVNLSSTLDLSLYPSDIALTGSIFWS